MTHINAAVIGAGFIGPVHVEALRRLGVPVAGILGADAAESRSAKEKLNLPKAYESYEEILNDRAVQSVHLAVPNRLHYELAKRALEAGKHVLCEKPLAMNSQESAELVELARNSDRSAGVNYNLRYYSLRLQVEDRADEGSLELRKAALGQSARYLRQFLPGKGRA